MNKFNILLIEDEEHIQELITYNLEKEGWQVSSYTSGEEGLEALQDKVPDVVLLDIMLPGTDGLSICREIRKDARLKNVSVIMITAKGEEADIVVGLELGADDYITKPFSPRVLLARIRAVMRRREENISDPENEEETIVKAHELTINPGRREVLIGTDPVVLTETEFRLLSFLARRPGWVYTRNQILDGVRGEDAIVTDRAVDVQVVGLRKKLGDAGRLIETVRGVGYRFQE